MSVSWLQKVLPFEGTNICIIKGRERWEGYFGGDVCWLNEADNGCIERFQVVNVFLISP